MIKLSLLCVTYFQTQYHISGHKEETLEMFLKQSLYFPSETNMNQGNPV
jgi:hypothetical protein